MYINDKFREGCNTLIDKIKSSYGLDDIYVQLNSTIIKNFLFALESIPSIQNNTILYESGKSGTIRDLIKTDVRGIDEDFMRVGDELYRYDGIFDIMSIGISDDTFDPIFDEGDIIQVYGTDKLRTLDVGGLNKHQMQHFKYIGVSEKISAGHGLVILVEDYFGTVIDLPQKMFYKSKETDLIDVRRRVLEDKVRNGVIDDRREKIDAIQAEYQTAVRDFVSLGSKMQSIMADDVEQFISDRIDGMINFATSFEGNKDIIFAGFTGMSTITVKTGFITCVYEEKGKEITANVGRYDITINLGIDVSSFSVSIKNIDIPQDTITDEYQHPHVDKHGSPCYGDWFNPLARHAQKGEYVGLILGLIEFLSHYNYDSPYITIDNFRSKRENKFKKKENELEKLK